MPQRRLRSAIRRFFTAPAFSPDDATAAPLPAQPRALLVRILGNDRPPQQPEGATLAQLQFILENEPPLPGLEKRWLLNRIVSRESRDALVALLEKHRQRWEELPFEPQAYAACFTDIGTVPEDYHPWGRQFLHLDATDQSAVVEYVGRAKNLHLIHRNGARNHALRRGLEEAEWVFAWDGACLLTAEAWAVIRPALALPDLAYVAIPVAPLPRDPQALVAAEQPPLARELPLLGFSRAARHHFDGQLREGAMAEEALLRRLGLPGPALDPPDGVCPWEALDVTPAADRARLVQLGWAYRLAGDVCRDSPGSAEENRALRLESIRRLTRKTDMQLIGEALEHQQLRCWTALTASSTGLAGVAAIAANARALPPPSVTDKPAVPPGTSPRHYVNAVPHWQTLAGSESALSRAGLLGQDGPLCGDVAQSYDRARLQLMVDSVCALALDGHLNANRDSIEHAHRLVRTWFLDPATAMIPDGAYARLSAVDPSRNVLDAAIDFRDLYPLLDAITLLRGSGRFSLAELQQLDEWFDAFLAWLAGDSIAFLTDHSTSPACTWYHQLMLAIAAFRGRRNVAAQVLDNLPGLLARQFRADGSPLSAPPPPSCATSTCSTCRPGPTWWCSAPPSAAICSPSPTATAAPSPPPSPTPRPICPTAPAPAATPTPRATGSRPCRP
ncbi:alginate lyase family protein [Cyanobium sp. BSA11S]|uniref:alginate lyase family protein n=1 Tax=Cyanobium sp. BSA11S TaxID=3108224 RepID=UPI003D8156C0